MLGTNVLDNQLQTGQTDMPTIIGVVKGTGAMDVKLETSGRGDDDMAAVLHYSSCQNFKLKNKTSDHGTQTELGALWES